MVFVVIKKKGFDRFIKGALMVEVALVLPILLAIVFFVIEFGNILYMQKTVNEIARISARLAAVYPSYTTTQLISQCNASSVVQDVSKLSLTVTPSPGASRNVGDAITVTAQYTYTPYINPFKLLNFSSSQTFAPTIRGMSVARAEVPL